MNGQHAPNSKTFTFKPPDHRASFETLHERFAVIMMGLVIRVFLVCDGMYLRCSFLTLSSSRYNDENYKIPVLVLNSAIYPLAYAFFKRGSHKEEVFKES